MSETKAADVELKIVEPGDEVQKETEKASDDIKAEDIKVEDDVKAQDETAIDPAAAGDAKDTNKDETEGNKTDDEETEKLLKDDEEVAAPAATASVAKVNESPKDVSTTENGGTKPDSKQVPFLKRPFVRWALIALFTILILVVIIVIIIVAAVHPDPSKKTPSKSPNSTFSYDDPRAIAQVSCGSLQGVIEDQVFVFKGIPYAEPPTGNNRWRRPKTESIKCGTENNTYNAKQFKSKCFQYEFGSEKIFGAEDCLYLNVWTPSFNKTRKRPVMVWIHGGYLQYGSGNTKGDMPTPEVTKSMDVVFVSFNYRVNAFGFMALEELSQNSTSKSSGNYGFMDQIAALTWVQDNIEQFGGDPSQVTVFGVSSGGTSIYALLASPEAKGLFSRAWLMSSSVKYEATLADAQEDNKVFLANTKCDQAANRLECLYNLTPREIVDAIPWDVYPAWRMADLTDIPKNGQFSGPVAIIDGEVIPSAPFDVWAQGAGNDVPLVIGNTAQEIDFAPTEMDLPTWTWEKYDQVVRDAMDSFDNTLADQVLQDYPHNVTPQFQFTSLVSDARVICATDVLTQKAADAFTSPVYRYVLTAVPSKPITLKFKYAAEYAFHGFDSMSFFGDFSKYMDTTGENENKLTEILRSGIKEFVTTGKITNWPDWETGTAIISNKVETRPRYKENECRRWEAAPFFPSYAWIN
ncbi:unnamed protein product [Owenia fusiformis]|uniref:Carboxylic ester hydrolase n=1 Tax=Owenia fusiformis TaxID=6347 RepID=A0A8J1TYR1_OWEFU|nr:unnamed protein product [Owenia fusiformis]